MDVDLEFGEAVRGVAGVAAAHADEVDRDARLPLEAVGALKEMKALSVMVPPEFGGPGVSLRAIADGCYELGRACSSTGMAFAMHQIQVATLLRHLDAGPWFEEYLGRLVAEQRVIGSVTSEVGIGGDMGHSIAAVSEVEGESGVLCFEKRATTVSYAVASDDFLSTLRRSPEAKETDQVLVMHSADQTELEQTSEWDTIGMRGTVSPAYVVRAKFGPEQVMAGNYGLMLTETIVPLTHIFWSHAWLGIATSAFERGRAFVRAQAHRNPGVPSSSARRLAVVMSDLSLLRSEVHRALDDFLAWDAVEGRAPLSTMAAELRFNNLKLGATRQTQKICLDVLDAIGMAAYRNNTPYSVGRQLRDALSGPLQVTNERIAHYDAALLTISKAV